MSCSLMSGTARGGRDALAALLPKTLRTVRFAQDANPVRGDLFIETATSELLFGFVFVFRRRDAPPKNKNKTKTERREKAFSINRSPLTGLTLVELLVVVPIIALAAALFLPASSPS